MPEYYEFSSKEELERTLVGRRIVEVIWSQVQEEDSFGADRMSNPIVGFVLDDGTRIEAIGGENSRGEYGDLEIIAKEGDDEEGDNDWWRKFTRRIRRG